MPFYDGRMEENVSDLLNVSSSPHVRSKDTTASIMRDVVIALIPAAAFGVYNFGLRALITILVCVASCVITEYLFEKGMKRKITIGDYSAVVTGMILAMNLPASVPFWMPIIGGVFAILVVKQLFGGLGQNFMNPALAGRCFLMISFAGRMTNFAIEKGSAFFQGAMGVDGFSGATPLALVENAENSKAALAVADSGVDVFQMFLGTTAGTIGETSVIALALGAAYMIYRKVISPKIPCIYIITTLIFMALFGGHLSTNDLPMFLAAQLCGGGLMFGAFFMATDYVTSPITPKGQIVFAVCLGLLTGIFRVFGPSAEGVSYAIILCNLLVPLIEKVTMPVAFGREGEKNAR